VKRWLSIGLLSVLGGLLGFVLLFQIVVPGGWRGVYEAHQAVKRFAVSGNRAFKVGEKFPDLQLKDLDGHLYRLSEHPHRLLLVNFFAPW